MTTVTPETAAATTREQLVETSNEAASVAWQNADALGGDLGITLALLTRTLAAGLNGVRVAILAACQPPEPRADRPAEIEPGFYEIELMGHRQRWAHVQPVTFAGRPLLEIRTPAYQRDTDNEPETVAELVEYYSPAAIFSLHPSTETEILDELRERSSYPF